MPITRTFTVAELEEIGVPDLPDELLVQDRAVDSGRWHETRECLFRHEGQVWSVAYQVGLTEYQECDLFADDPVKATAMEQREVTVTKWLPVEEAS